MSKIFIIWRIDFDSMENREPITRRLLGYARDVAERDRALSTLTLTTETYKGFDGGWGGAETTYPKFEAQKAKSIIDKDSDKLPCSGTCDYCRGDAPLFQAPICVCGCKVHFYKEG